MNKRIENFKKLNKAEKINIITEILDNIQDDFFKNINKLIKTLKEDTPNQLLDLTYSIILEALEKIKINKKNEKIQQMEKIKNYLKTLQQKEKEIDKNEIDKILDEKL